MRWDDKLFSGTHEKWHWAVSREMVRALEELAVTTFTDHYLCIVSFDGGSISPGPEECALGWSCIGGVMVSPRLHPAVNIPCDTHDEWYIFRTPPEKFPKFDRFVNYGAFNLADPRQMAETFDPTWERSGLDWLYPLQERFWALLEQMDPIAYIGSGDNDIVVSTNRDFVSKFLAMARTGTT